MICGLCDLTSKNYGALKTHFRMVHQPGQFCCFECGPESTIFKTRSEVFLHARRTHLLYQMPKKDAAKEVAEDDDVKLVDQVRVFKL